MPNRSTIILIAGFSSTPHSLRIMRKRLIKDGYNVVIQTLFDSKLWEPRLGLIFYAQRLDALVRDLRGKSELGNQKIFVLAHSAGGLIARYYIQSLGGEQDCDGLITMATPHRGLWLAGLGFFSPLILKAKCLYDILPMSDFIKTLNSASYPNQFPILSLSSNEDRLVSEPSSKLPSTVSASSHSEEKLIPGVPHVGFLYQRNAYQLVKSWIQKTSATQNGSLSYDKLKKSS